MIVAPSSLTTVLPRFIFLPFHSVTNRPEANVIDTESKVERELRKEMSSFLVMELIQMVHSGDSDGTFGTSHRFEEKGM